MTKRIIKNSFLVLVLSGLFMFPVFSFGFIQKPTEDTRVLGTNTYIRKEINKDIKPIDKIDLTLNLNEDERQVLYNVIPENYAQSDYQYVLVVPGSYDDKIAANLVESENTYNLSVESITDEMPKKIEVTILVFE